MMSLLNSISSKLQRLCKAEILVLTQGMPKPKGCRMVDAIFRSAVMS